MAAPIRLGDAHQAWVSPPLDGQLYGEPLVVGSTVVVATENDTVYALDSSSGQVRWSTHLGRPVDASILPCGNISPTVGITSTPVIDEARQEVFVVADLDGTNGPFHQLVGLDVATGGVELRQAVDPPGSDPAALLQRAALTLDNGDVVFGYGGNYSDCSTYHGWIISAPETGGASETYELDATPGNSQGAIWMGGAAPIVDSQGNVWAAAGNGSVTSAGHPYDGSDSVFELSSTLRLLQFFAPSGWFSDNGADRDLGSSSPVLLSNGLVLQAGKSQTAYLLSAGHLGGIGGELDQVGSYCGNEVAGGSAVVGAVAYVPCMSGIEAVATSASPPSLRVVWQDAVSGGPPIVAGGMVWTISQAGVLYGLNPSTGSVVQRFSIGSVANHFPTPSAGGGLLLAPAADQVYAYVGA